ncbi:MAG: patatin-like phospholipase family protein [Acidobacteria bacterium]|nr:patatin-like phospholipase family protein [Acidobacteriota bacterium]
MTRALVLSGGGVRGIFQAGVIGRLAERGENGWEVFTGVSAGAINAFLAAQDRVREMEDLWVRQAENGLTAFRSRLDLANLALHALAPGLLSYADVEAMDGLYDNQELLEILEPFAAGLADRLERLGHHLRIGVVCLQTGEYLAADPTRHVAPPEIARLVLASTAIPLAFDPVELTLDVPGAACSGRRCQFADGGARNITPLADAIGAAREAGIALEGIDVIQCLPWDPSGTRHEYHGLLQIGLRAQEILTNDNYRNDLELFLQANALAALREELLSSGDEPSRTVLDRLTRAIPGFERHRPMDLRIIRPTPESWQAFTGRPDADLAVELPGDLDRNAGLLRLIHGYGRWLAEHPELHTVVGSEREHRG